MMLQLVSFRISAANYVTVRLRMINAPGTLTNKSKPAPNRRIRQRNRLF